MIERSIKKATKYFDETGDHVFSYREKQLHSIICPSISEITYSFLIEHPLKRKPANEEKYSGNVDYWASYKGIGFFIELKHAYFACSQETPRKSIGTRFNRAIRQLKDIRSAECRNVCNDDRFLKIALEGVTFFKSNYSKENLTFERSEIIEVFDWLKKSKSLNKANFYALWILDKRMNDPFEYSNGFEFYPAVTFIGKIF